VSARKSRNSRARGAGRNPRLRRNKGRTSETVRMHGLVRDSWKNSGLPEKQKKTAPSARRGRMKFCCNSSTGPFPSRKMETHWKNPTGAQDQQVGGERAPGSCLRHFMPGKHSREPSLRGNGAPLSIPFGGNMNSVTECKAFRSTFQPNPLSLKETGEGILFFF